LPGFQKQRPITSVAAAVETKISQPMKSAIKAAIAASDDKPTTATNGHATKKRKSTVTKNGDGKRKKATDFF
jgi:hypothetical protein